MQENTELNKISKFYYNTFNENHVDEINTEKRKAEMKSIQENSDEVYFNKNEINNDITISSNLKKLGKLLLVNSLFLIFNNAQLSIILTFVNKKYPKEETLTNSIGTVNTIMNILIYPFILGVASTLEILGSQSFGARKLNLFSYYLTNLRLIGNVFILMISFLILYFHENIFNIWKIDHEVQFEALRLIFFRFISLIFEFEIYIKLRFLQIINKSYGALFIITINGIFLPLFAYIFIFVLDMYAQGCGFVYVFNNIFMLISLLIYTGINEISEKYLLDNKYKENCLKNIERIDYDLIEKNNIKINLSNEISYLNRKKQTPNSQVSNCMIILNENVEDEKVLEKEQINKLNHVLDDKLNNSDSLKDFREEQNFLNLFQIIIPLFLITFMDNLSVESMSIFANYFEAKEYSEFLNAYSLYGLVGTISVSFNTSASIMISSNYGVLSGKKMKKLFHDILKIGFCISIILGIVLILFSEKLLGVLLQSSEIGENIKYMFHLSIICIMIDIIQYILLSALKSFGFIYLGFSVYFVGNLMNFLMIYFFAFNTKMKIYGIFFGYLINEIITISMYIFVFFFFVSFHTNKI